MSLIDEMQVIKLVIIIESAYLLNNAGDKRKEGMKWKLTSLSTSLGVKQNELNMTSMKLYWIDFMYDLLTNVINGSVF